MQDTSDEADLTGPIQGGMVSATPGYPVMVQGKLDPQLNRWLWLVKWLLAIPHYIVLVFLWIAFIVLSILAFVAIVVTGKYPRVVFDFNVGVLRWTWRVAFYSYSALGTDRYPPFTLTEVPDYPATLEITYPGQLSRGLAFVKWWLLAIPHYALLAIFYGGGSYGGLVTLLVLFAAVALLFTGRYPPGIFDFVLGLNRWGLRVAAYAGLMTDQYPPFRLDLGGGEPVGVEVRTPSASQPAFGGPRSRWSAGRVLLVVVGSLATAISLALLVAGSAVVIIDQTQRDEDGFLMSPSERLSTDTYALVSETIGISVDGPDWLAEMFLGQVKVQSRSLAPVFVGIAPDVDAATYLEGVQRAIFSDFGTDRESYRVVTGSAPAGPPAAQPFWVASSVGSAEHALTWEVKDGNWTVVVMNEDAGPGVTSDLSVGAEVEPLLWIGIGLLIAGGVLLLGGVGMVILGIRK